MCDCDDRFFQSLKREIIENVPLSGSARDAAAAPRESEDRALIEIAARRAG
jgi:hypothetical protein